MRGVSSTILYSRNTLKPRKKVHNPPRKPTVRPSVGSEDMRRGMLSEYPPESKMVVGRSSLLSSSPLRGGESGTRFRGRETRTAPLGCRADISRGALVSRVDNAPTLSQGHVAQGARTGQRPGPNAYLVSIFRLIFAFGRLSNWLSVLVSLLRPLYWA